MSAVKAESAFEPRNGLRGSARPHQNDSALAIDLRVTWVDLERAVNLRERQIVPSFVHVDDGQQAIRAGRRGIKRQRLLGERLGLLDLFLAKFGPSRYDGLEMRAASAA